MVSNKEYLQVLNTGRLDMSDLYSFISTCGKFQFVVQRKYLSLYGDPARIDNFENFGKNNMQKYLHNPDGPALMHLNTNHVEFWMNGEQLTTDDYKKVCSEGGLRYVSNINFNNTIDNILNKD